MSRSNRLFINEVSSCVDEMLVGVVHSNPGTVLLEGHRVVVRSDIQKVKDSGQVTVICGGGSGHEPFAAGFVGEGMLSAAVAGSVFASPPPTSILAAIKAVQSPGGTLVIVANYTGDRLNFGIAAERAIALGVKVAIVVVGEDCAVQSIDKTAGRRGLVGIVSAMKIAGALAEQGKSLEEIVKVVEFASNNMGTIGVSLSACSVPGTGPSFFLAETDMEVGLGAHGEAGVERIKIMPADETVEYMLNMMTDKSRSCHLPLQYGEKVSLIMNNLGGISELEMHILGRKAIQWLEDKGVKVSCYVFGHFMTSLDMAGFNMNLTKLDNTLESCLNYPTKASGWPSNNIQFSQERLIYMKSDDSDNIVEDVSEQIFTEEEKRLYNTVLEAVRKCCIALVSNEAYLNELDSGAGDGDCGSTFKRGATKILSALESVRNKSVVGILELIASCAENYMGGASGGVYSLLFTTACRHLNDPSSLESWRSALSAGITSVSRYGGAELGDRTMLDALFAILKTLQDAKSNSDIQVILNAAAKNASKAATATVHMKAKAGRASYVNAEHLTKPDAGAVGVSIWMTELANLKS